MNPAQLFGQYGVTNFYYVTVLIENGWTRIGKILDNLPEGRHVFVESGLSQIGIIP